MGDRTYIENFTRTLMGQIGTKVDRFMHHTTKHLLVQELVPMYWTRIHYRIGLLGDEALGKLACSGIGTTHEVRDVMSMKEVHEFRPAWLDMEHDGRVIVRCVATTAVIAAMADYLWNEKMRRIDFEHTSEFRDEARAFRRGEEIDLSKSSLG